MSKKTPQYKVAFSFSFQKKQIIFGYSATKYYFCTFLRKGLIN